MKVKIVTYILLIFSLFFLFSCSKKTITLNSPDKRISIQFKINKKDSNQNIPIYNVYFNKTPILIDSELGIDFKDSGVFKENVIVKDVSYDSKDEIYPVINGKTAKARNHYNEANITLKETVGLKREIILSFRAYKDGVAFRYTIPKQNKINEFVIRNELSNFKFTNDSKVYYLSFGDYTNSHEGTYKIEKMSELVTDTTHIDLPVLIETKESIWIAITEAALVDYAGLNLKKSNNANTFQSDLTPSINNADIKVKGTTPHKSPWRVLMIADNPGRLIESNIILNLNEPCKIKNTEWIKPGKTTWHWWNGTIAKNVNFNPGMNTATMKYYIDFCAENNIDYHALVDQSGQGWYGKSRGDLTNEDITTSIPEIDLQEILTYAKKKGIGIRVWLHHTNVKRQMEEAFPLYEKWGIKGYMLDFFDEGRADQETVNFSNQVLKESAKHHLKVQFHGAYKPTGLRRTFPNLVNIEGVLNLEYLKWSDRCTPEHNVIVPFTRMLAGPMDYHLGGFRSVKKEEFNAEGNLIEPVVMGTRCHHLAMYVVYENPVPSVCDYPEAYKNQLGFEFIKQVPTVWDDINVINAKVGEYITIARRKGDEWYIGSMTDWTGRKIKIPLDFLSEGNYSAEIYSDIEESNKNPNMLEKEEYLVTSKDIIITQLVSGGGNVIKVSPTGLSSKLPKYSEN